MSAVFSGCLICNVFLLHFQPPNSTTDNTGNLRFKNIPSSFAATFFMMLDNLQYDNILLNYSGSVGNGLVLFILYFAYCFMMPIIFLNLLVSRTRTCCCIKLTKSCSKERLNFNFSGELKKILAVKILT